eukprot:CAMPEP_0114354728 /NCGR_PEP_ID=MMETSP0101-20121206/19699_1 /TAXON_ID=38822 ORGANISM="Pteridomonas danica, Strain PT" /NCGR_SAMPLE_ID=MMETSP0101 /ASSEMBLY_ACC=CAM_ASM_000211 /LENGTH=563 /DNA_ID=CAMNT_0001496345 /DNA_START=19 /DNA_END=1710 /DNA_ORIENTATION=-
MASTSVIPEVPAGYRFLKEGTASILLYQGDEALGDKGEPVFYNKVQVLNRDLSIRVISQFVRERALEIANPQGNRAKRRAAALAFKAKQQGTTKSSEDKETIPVKDMTNDQLDEKLRKEATSNGITILDALAATGLRSIRYFKEIPGVKQVLVNDLDPAAVEAAKRNVEFNGLTLDQVSPSQGDAIVAMLTSGKKFDVIDLDPYGSAAPFLDSAVQAVADGGLLCVTCTDMAVLSGNQAEACYAKYGSMPTKGRYLHEMALRILLHSLETSACRYRRHIVPVLSCGIDFYIRVFLRVYESPAEVKRTCLKQGYVYQSIRCPSFHMQPVARLNGHTFNGALSVNGGACAETGGGLRVGGPIWTEPIHNLEWVNKMKDHVAEYRTHVVKGNELPFPPTATHERLHGLLTAVSEELPDVPLYYTLPSLCETLHCESPKMNQIKSALINAGYRVSAFHKECNAIKTDAPNQVVWDVMRCWVQKHPLNKKREEAEKSPGTLILDTAPAFEADFSQPKGVSLAKPKACRFPMNPEDNWGPKSRARSKKPAAASEEETSEEPAVKQARIE